MASEQDTTIVAGSTSSVSKSSEGARPRGRERPSHPAQTVNAETGGCRCGGLRDVGWQALYGRSDLIPQALDLGSTIADEWSRCPETNGNFSPSQPSERPTYRGRRG